MKYRNTGCGSSITLDLQFHKIFAPKKEKQIRKHKNFVKSLFIIFIFYFSASLVFSFGYKSPGHNIPYYNHLVKQTADTIKSQMKNNRKAESSGVIINTCGWIKGLGYDVIKHAAQAFEVDMIIVLDEDRLYR